ncbi:hypothetical protein BWQ96_10496 [Gracilariopsis chorda]|uniref:Uncharacterized protein n=1 Tax=Gracilariopsis chorda TaxID=448386 RepID=A0A2V3ICI5_9FLOR|nr:hypothetical protein BWQ96_10496 [Gracilariopsis chorda]|eukprot:PXF39799.1 hypothetical protein BWQ96_10496 [Gracilariopsis chorda]
MSQRPTKKFKTYGKSTTAEMKHDAGDIVPAMAKEPSECDDTQAVRVKRSATSNADDRSNGTVNENVEELQPSPKASGVRNSKKSKRNEQKAVPHCSCCAKAEKRLNRYICTNGFWKEEGERLLIETGELQKELKQWKNHAAALQVEARKLKEKLQQIEDEGSSS